MGLFLKDPHHHNQYPPEVQLKCQCSFLLHHHQQTNLLRMLQILDLVLQ